MSLALHVLFLTRSDVGKERILAFTDRFTWKQVIDEILKMDAQSKAKDVDFSSGDFTERDLTTVDTKRTFDILEHTQADLTLTLKQLLGKADVHKGPRWY